jgi:gliding motility-associated-like protein
MRRVSIIALFMVCAQSGLANIYYVSTSGNDNGDGSPGNPWRTLRAAVTKVAAGQGHTIRLSHGTFVESGSFNVPQGINIEGAGVDQTIIKAASSFYFNPGDPGFALDKFLMTLNSSGFSDGNQTLKDFTIDGDGKRLHGGIYVKNRNNIAIENVKVKETNFCGIWIWDVKNSRLRQITLINCSWGSTGWASGGLQLANLESVDISGLNIDENTGYGIKALGSGGNRITRLKVHDSRISVNPAGKWNNGSAPNIAFELWEVYLTDCEIYNTYMDNHLSLVNVQTPPTGGRSIRVHHNVFDLLERAGGRGYAIELSINDAEIDNNLIKGGSYGIAHWSPAYCANWSIHHNTFHSLSSGYPGDIVRAQVSGLHNVRFHNNTIELMGNATINVIGLHAGKSDNLDLKNNLIINSNTSYAWFPNQLIFLEKGASLSGLNVGNNLLDKLPLGSVAGTYTNNLETACKINQSGNRPDPYYLPAVGSPLIDAGVNVGQPFQGAAPDIGAHEVKSAAAPINQLPVITITAPANNEELSKGSSVLITADASDKDGTVSKVEFFNGATKLGEDATAPFSFEWKDLREGSHTLTAKATDNAGGSTTSSAVKIQVAADANELPIVSLIAPVNNATFSKGSSVLITADASDKDGTVSKVEFFNGTLKLGEDATSPFNFEWKDLAEGSHTLTAKAIDNAGGISTSPPVTIEVRSASNALPIVAITSPSTGSEFPASSSVTIKVNASDADGSVAKVEFFSGTDKLGEDTSSPFSFAWDNLPVGAYSLTAKAIDNLGGSATSPAIAITVTSFNAKPDVSLTTPVEGAVFDSGAPVVISASASDKDGKIDRVEFYAGDKKIGEDTSNPYTLTWSDASEGQHVITARATDDHGESITSPPVKIIVNTAIPVEETPVSLNITSPHDNALIATGQTIIIITNVSGISSGKVEFFHGTLKLGEDATAPYSFEWNGAPEGNFTITARLVDNHGPIAMDEVTITVIGNPIANAGEDESLSYPANSIQLTGHGSSADGSDVLFSWEKISGPDEASFSDKNSDTPTLNNLVEGTYIIELTVTDKNGMKGKDQLQIHVSGSDVASNTIPRYFTPNDDGINDKWEWPDVEQFANSPLIIFNRAGQKIFEVESYNNSWDGTSSGMPLQPDAYYYVIRSNGGDIKGAVRIIR